MFDVAWQELLVIGIVALIVVGPKELPTLLRTVGKYLGIVKRQAAEFRAQFDEAMRESELAQLKKDVENIKSEAESTFRDVESSVHSHVSGVGKEFDDAAHGITAAQSHDALHDANGLPMSPSASEGGTASSPSAPPGGAGAAAIAAAAAAAPPPATRPEPAATKPATTGSGA